MDYRVFVLSALSILIVMLFIQRLIMPQLARGEILFGVRLPAELWESPELVGYKKAYRKNYILVCGVYTLCLGAFLWKMPDNVILLGGLIIFFLLSSWLYYNAHRKVKEFKLARAENGIQKQVVLVETSFRNDYAIMLHMLVNLPIPLVKNPVLIEAYVLLAALIALAFIKKSRKLID